MTLDISVLIPHNWALLVAQEMVITEENCCGHEK